MASVVKMITDDPTLKERRRERERERESSRRRRGPLGNEVRSVRPAPSRPALPPFPLAITVSRRERLERVRLDSPRGTARARIYTLGSGCSELSFIPTLDPFDPRRLGSPGGSLLNFVNQ